MRRVGILGGTFDPIHHGHLVAAQEVYYRLKLDKVYFVPAGHPPHKPQKIITPPEMRVEMVRLAIEHHQGFDISRVDVDRPGPSYTIETLELLKQAWLETQLHFIMGMDSLSDFLTWHAPERIIALTRLAVVSRPHYEADLQSLEKALPRLVENIDWVPMPWMEISSTDLQRRVREGAPIRYLVPPAIESYIQEHNLYRE
ncbi:MAG: nicotinate-nucleotide adenylyltransferase [Chloroflexi bacterium]|nr:nicotinate-nucleotide adenylyltransferase [Chloroflexota bacterium]